MYYVQIWKTYPGWWQVLVPAGASLRTVIDALAANPSASVKVYQSQGVLGQACPPGYVYNPQQNQCVAKPAERFTNIGIANTVVANIGVDSFSKYVLVASGTGAQVSAQLGFPQLQRAVAFGSVRVGQTIAQGSPALVALAAARGASPGLGPYHSTPNAIWVKRYYPAIGWQWVPGADPITIMWQDISIEHALQLYEPLFQLTDAQGSAIITAQNASAGPQSPFWHGTGTGFRTFFTQCILQPSSCYDMPLPASDANIRRRQTLTPAIRGISPWASPSGGW